MKRLIINEYLNDPSNNYKELILKIFSDLNMECSDMRWLFYDKTGVVLLYPNKPYKLISEIKDKLSNLTVKEVKKDILIREESVFLVSGNGWGTGLSIMCNYPKYN